LRGKGRKEKIAQIAAKVSDWLKSDHIWLEVSNWNLAETQKPDGK